MALLSRVAERLYWGARYLERAEDASRVLQSFGDVLADYPGSGMQWSSLVAVAGAGGKDAAGGMHVVPGMIPWNQIGLSAGLPGEQSGEECRNRRAGRKAGGEVEVSFHKE